MKFCKTFLMNFYKPLVSFLRDKKFIKTKNLSYDFVFFAKNISQKISNIFKTSPCCFFIIVRYFPIESLMRFFNNIFLLCYGKVETGSEQHSSIHHVLFTACEIGIQRQLSYFVKYLVVCFALQFTTRNLHFFQSLQK